MFRKGCCHVGVSVAFKSSRSWKVTRVSLEFSVFLSSYLLSTSVSYTTGPKLKSYNETSRFAMSPVA